MASSVVLVFVHPKDNPSGLLAKVSLFPGSLPTWEGFLQKVLPIVEASYCGPFSWTFFDDDEDEVTITNQLEWQEALRLSQKPKRLDLLVGGKSKASCCPPTTNPSSSTIPVPCKPQPSSSNSSCCPPKPASNKCCPSKPSTMSSPCCAPPSKPCNEPISRDPKIFDWQRLPKNDEVPLKKVGNPTASTYQYSGDSLMAFACPLGPIGGGCIALAGDGGLRQWQIGNVVNHLGHVPDSFFAIKTVDSTKQQKAFVLQSNALYDQSGFTPAPMVTDHVVPAASIELLKELPGVNDLLMTGKYPIMECDYLGGETPVQLHLEAMNPTIALNSKDSGLPVIVFNFTATNPTSSPIDVTLMTSLQNCIGWDGQSVITNEVCDPGYGGNTNSLVTLNGLTALDMTNPTLQAADAKNGHVSVAFLNQSGDQMSYMTQYSAVTNMWQYFTTTGLPGQGISGPSPAGKTWNGALACTRTLGPQESSTYTFMLAWHYPNRYVNWDQSFLGIDDTHTQYWLGNQYANFWPTILQALEYTRDNYTRLMAETRLFRDAMFTTNLPWQLVDSAAGRIQPIKSPSMMWTGDGNMFIFEGCSTTAGCCPLNCTHVLTYAMALSRCWPDLEQTVRNNDLDIQISPNGIIPSRTPTPIWLRREWTWWPDYTEHPLDQTICSDGEIGTVLKTYREVLMGASADWFADKWHQAQKIMTRWMTIMDSGNGLVTCAQPSTYDTPLYGANTLMGSYYLAALRASEEMANLTGDSTLAATYHDRFVLASQNYDSACFPNGKWYTQQIDPKNDLDVISDGTFVDALGGQWWAYLLGLGPVLPLAHVQSNVQNVFSTNHVDSFVPSRQYPRQFFDSRDAGMYICTWGGAQNPAPSNALLYTSEGAWSGLEHPFAGLALQVGQTDVALQVMLDCRNKYDGTRRSPWNEIECGDHYTRQMAGFALFEIASGQLWNAPLGMLSFGPVLNASAFTGFYITGTGWGQFVQQSDAGLTTGTASVAVWFGTLSLTVLRLNIPANTATITVEGEAVAATLSRVQDGNSNYLVATFPSQVTVQAGQTLEVSFSP